MAHADASSYGDLSRDATPEGPGRDNCGEHDQAVVEASSQEHPRAGRVEHRAGDRRAPSQRQRDVSVRTSQAGGQGNRSTLSIGEFVDERIEIATALIIKARFQLGNKR